MRSEDPPEFAGYALDLDGTVYLGDALLPGAAEAIGALRGRGARVVFLTNNPLHTAGEYAAKLTGLGIETTVDDVVTAVDALAAYLHARHAGHSLMLIAEDTVAERVVAEGFEVAPHPHEAQVVVVSFDRTFDYRKLHDAFRAVRHNGAAIVATNPDPYCPTPEGGLPDCAAMLAAVEACTGARAEAIVGKPSPHMGRALLDRLGLDARRVAVVGDRLLTDVAMGLEIGATGILVLSGATTEYDVAASPIVPDHVLAGVGELASPTPQGSAP